LDAKRLASHQTVQKALPSSKARTRYTEMGEAPCPEALGWNTIDQGAAPGSGTVGERVRVLREVSLPMQLNELVQATRSSRSRGRPASDLKSFKQPAENDRRPDGGGIGLAHFADDFASSIGGPSKVYASL
jgi:hypothetical protein